jgi:hypothetical protein
LSKLCFKGIPILYKCCVFLVGGWIYVRADDGCNLFLGVASHVCGGEHDFVDVVDAFAF